MRDNAIDVYRCLLMFGICLLHSIAQGGHNVPWAANMLEWCVPGFMFISGWFGIRFSFLKVAKLYGISLYCAGMFVAFDTLFVNGEAGHNCLMRIYGIAIGQWFLNAYVIVMCLAPTVNLAIDRMTVKELYPLVLVAFGWSFATTLPIAGYVPKSQGLTAYSFLTLLATYVVARFARMVYDAGEGGGMMKNRAVVFPVLVVCLIMAAIGFGDYNSPFAIVIAGGMFFMPKSCCVPRWLEFVCVWLGPSMFSVYLMHSHGQGWGYLKCFQDWLLSMRVPLWGALFLTAVVVFVFCVLADIPRRTVAMLVKRIK